MAGGSHGNPHPTATIHCDARRRAACRGELAQAMDRGNPLSDRQRREPIDVAGEERIARDKERVGPLLGKGREGRLEIVFAADVQDESRHPERLRRDFIMLLGSAAAWPLGANA